MKFGILIFITTLAVFAETLFEVKDSSNYPVLNVSSEGLTVLNNGDTIMVIGAQGIKAYIQSDAKNKVLTRTFAVTTTSSKDGSKGQNKVFEIATDEGATFYNPKNNADTILTINKSRITANVNPGLNRDFVVNDQASVGKAGGGNLMKVSNKDGFEAVNDSTMLYYKKKNAFRIGYVSISDPDSVGQASFASGYKNVAMGPCATAMGIYTKSMGYGSTATGTLTKALAISSTAMGSGTTASGYNSTSMGYQSEASGNNSTASGWLTTSQSMNEFVVGNLNYDWGSHNLWIDSDPLFVVGNGIILGPNSYDRKNAVTVLKNGFMSIGNIIPNSRLDVAGDVRINDNSLYLRGPNDTNHGLKYVATWDSKTINGPVLFGYAGGALGTMNGSLALYWDDTESIYIPNGNLTVSTGNVGLGVSPDSSYRLNVMGNGFGIKCVSGSTGTTSYGVFGQASGGTSINVGIYGATALSPGARWAGYFAGDINVTGTVVKSSSKTMIDHPLDPKNKFLVHSPVESDKMMNIYNGITVLDGKGRSVVTMPNWFEALNTGFRYQLTPIGAPGPNLYIAKKISGNSFEIAGGEPGMEVSWEVTGIRNDNYAKEIKYEAEKEKEGIEKGYYLHPESYGLSEEMGIEHQHRKLMNENNGIK